MRFFLSQTILRLCNCDISRCLQREQHPPSREGNKSSWFCLGSLPTALNIGGSLYFIFICSKPFILTHRTFPEPLLGIFSSSLFPTKELKHFWDARRARWPSLSLSPRHQRQCQPHSSVHQGSVGTGQDKLLAKRELLVPWPV